MPKQSELVEVLEETEVANPKNKTTVAKVPPTGVRLPSELRGQVDEICEGAGIPLATFIRDAVEAQVLTKKPELARRALLRLVALTAEHFERALEIGILKGTEAEEQAEDVRRFFDQFAELLKVEPEHEIEEA